jgi:hypothetical protein
MNEKQNTPDIAAIIAHVAAACKKQPRTRRGERPRRSKFFSAQQFEFAFTLGQEAEKLRARM